jgi:hypothetical protein
MRMHVVKWLLGRRVCSAVSLDSGLYLSVVRRWISRAIAMTNQEVAVSARPPLKYKEKLRWLLVGGYG